MKNEIRKFEELVDRNSAMVDDLQNEVESASEEFGKYLREYRKVHKASLRSFAKKLKISPAYLCDMELGRRHIGYETLEKLKKI